jgi:hypothetical protein
MPKRVALKYFDFIKYSNPNAHVRMFNYIIKNYAKTFEEYIINAFNYMLRDMESNWCHNYMSKFLDCIFSKLTQAFCKYHWKT